ncbi:hypothetical protein TNCV_885441 [Trichonephila clavipes]|nr:hypothetical protein TNCV_885441 [Trichonephila clavipes]
MNLALHYSRNIYSTLYNQGSEIKETNAASVKKKVLLSLTSKPSSVENVNVSVSKKKEKTDNDSIPATKSAAWRDLYRAKQRLAPLPQISN